jgi:hypothetical protein
MLQVRGITQDCYNLIFKGFEGREAVDCKVSTHHGYMMVDGSPAYPAMEQDREVSTVTSLSDLDPMLGFNYKHAWIHKKGTKVGTLDTTQGADIDYYILFLCKLILLYIFIVINNNYIY